MKKRFFTIIKNKFVRISLIFTLVLGIGIGVLSFTEDSRNFAIIKNLDIFYSMFRELNSYYVDKTDPEKLIKISMDKMLESLDPYTTYIPESEMDDFKFMTTGEYGGIGSLITKSGDYIVISEPYEGFPAQKTGLKAGDKILEIDGKSMKDKSSSDVSDNLKGPQGTKFTVKVERFGQPKPLTFTITREKISINPVPYYGMLDSETGIIMLKNFTQGCSNELQKSFIDLRDKQKAKQIILDLRGNPGGLLEEAIRIVNLFVPKGVDIVSTKGNVKEWDKVYRATEMPMDTIMPLVVLIDRGSASASEIVAGSLQDLDRAVVIGQRSFGKGLVQTTRNLSYNTKLKVTTAKYYIPSGRCIQAVDYKNRNEDGSVGEVADSLISKFSTKKGRTVFDGGGVSPDIIVEQEKITNISIAVVTQSVLFEFATKYYYENPTIPTPENFVITDDIYKQFTDFAVAKPDLKYTSGTITKLNELIKTATREGYYDEAQGDFEALSNALALDKAKDLAKSRKQISLFLSDEILKRYYYQKGAIKNSILTDDDITEAKRILAEKSKYSGLLDGTVLSHAGDKKMSKKGLQEND